MILLTYFLICFSDFVPDAATRNDLGMYYQSVTFTNIAVHMLIMIRTSYKTARLACLKRRYAKQMKQKQDVAVAAQ